MGNSSENKRKGNTGKYILGVIFLLLLLVTGGVAYWWNWANQPYSSDPDGKLEQFVVKQGMTASSIANELEERKLIRNALVFRYLASQQNVDSKLMAGEYRLASYMSLQEIIDIFLAGPEAESIKVTIPEGYSTEKVIDTLVSKGLGTKEEYLQAIAEENFDFAFLADLPQDSTRLDGFLFPDTYFFDPKASPKDNLTRMLQRFEQEITEEVLAKLKEKNLSIRDWVNLAALVEREAGQDEDRPLVASVFLNRLEINMPLQSCATLQYILKTDKFVFSTEDTKVESPYNTYIHTGLPPSPIANPGHASLAAVLDSPETDYLYFLANREGETFFSKTYQEHQRKMKEHGLS